MCMLPYDLSCTLTVIFHLIRNKSKCSLKKLHNINWAFCTFMAQMFHLTFINDIQDIHIIYVSDNNVRDTSEN